jgi:DNA-binding SARP family transcriptional activator
MTRGRDDRARYSNFWEQIDLTAIRFCDMIERRYDLSIIGVCPTEYVCCGPPGREPMARLAAHLLGPFQVTLDGQPLTGFESDKARALLAYLVVETGWPHRRERLAGLLWPERCEQAARANLRRVLANLRQITGDREAEPHLLSITPQTVQLDGSGDLWSDVAAFAALQPAPLRADLQAQPAIDRAERAAALYRGEFLEGFSLAGSADLEEWVLVSRERYRRLVMQALRRLATHYERCGEFDRALAYAWRQVELDAWQEGAHLQVMRLLALDGQRAAALAQYETCRRLLHQELGVKPSAETTRLYERIRSEGRLDKPADHG